MQYIVIETFGGYSNVVTDEEGNTKVFDTIEEAQAEADDCQNGKVVPL